MSFEEYHLSNPQYTYLVAKIQYNLLNEKKATLNNLVISFSAPEGDCESCSA